MCPLCHIAPPEVGVLCGVCRAELLAPVDVTSQQVVLHAEHPTSAALIDQWGRAHPLEAPTIVGRAVEAHGLAILVGSVSRRHATIALVGNEWFLTDLGSVNGTYLNDGPVVQPTEIREGDRIRFGHMVFFFVGDISLLPQPRFPRAISETTPPIDVSVVRHPTNPTNPYSVPPTESDGDTANYPTKEFRIHEPTGGGGGIIEVDGASVQLTTPQFELVMLLIERMQADVAAPSLLRGFVPSTELIAHISWDSPVPTDGLVSQLVRRVRRLLVKAGIGDLIESRHRLGYRLRAIPLVTRRPS